MEIRRLGLVKRSFRSNPSVFGQNWSNLSSFRSNPSSFWNCGSNLPTYMHVSSQLFVLTATCNNSYYCLFRTSADNNSHVLPSPLEFWRGRGWSSFLFCHSWLRLTFVWICRSNILARENSTETKYEFNTKFNRNKSDYWTHYWTHYWSPFP